MGKFAVIDTETNWADLVMSIGTVIADADTFELIEAKYHILPIECEIGGMYEGTLFIKTPVHPILCTRAEAISDLRAWFGQHEVRSIFAYNACFDRNHLPELRNFDWYDIMRLAAYRQYNPKIPANADCCSTGRLKRGYGVEPMLRMLSGKYAYCESHNAFYDAIESGGSAKGLLKNRIHLDEKMLDKLVYYINHSGPIEFGQTDEDYEKYGPALFKYNAMFNKSEKTLTVTAHTKDVVWECLRIEFDNVISYENDKQSLTTHLFTPKRVVDSLYSPHDTGSLDL